MRVRRARPDDNQDTIVKDLRAIGASVAVTSAAGDGFPDLVIGYQGKNYLLEVKDGNKPPSKQKLTPDQVRFHRDWRGSVFIANSPDQALALLGVER